MASKEEAQIFVDELRAKLGKPLDYVFFIPHWDPVDSEEGLWWVTSQLWEGFYVDYRVDLQKKRVYLKSWEFGEDEPAWSVTANGI